MRLRSSLCKMFQKSPKRPTGIADVGFNGVLKRTEISFKQACALDTFQMLASDVLESISGSRENLTFLPSLTSILHVPHGMPQARKLFRDDVSLFNWLDLRDSGDRETIRYRATCTQNYQVIRMLAGSRWYPEDHDQPVCIFPRLSCSE